MDEPAVGSWERIMLEGIDQGSIRRHHMALANSMRHLMDQLVTRVVMFTRVMFPLLILFFPLALASLRAVGNVAIVARASDLASTPRHPILISATELICSAEKLGEPVGIEACQFTRKSDGEKFQGVVHQNKAHLAIGKAPLAVIGVYVCEMRTTTDELVKGNLNIYLGPVFKFEQEEGYSKGADQHSIQIHKQGRLGHPLTLPCPAYGHPPPFTWWTKDGEAIPDDGFSFEGHNLRIEEASPAHSGIYICTADNSFPLYVGGPSITNHAKLNITLSVN